MPLAVKVGPFFSSMANMAPARRRRGGRAGPLQPVLPTRLDLDRLEVRPNLVLSTSAELRLVLSWIAILTVGWSVAAATTGIHDSDDVVKVILAGADVTIMASALLRHGPSHLATGAGAGLRGSFEERKATVRSRRPKVA